MAYIHGKGTAHRDLDPKNIMTKDGEIKIVDFGLACHLSSETRFDKTMVGKVKYSSPEVFSGRNYNALKTDIYSLGCILYFLLTGLDSCNNSPLSAFSSMGILEDIVIPSQYSLDVKNLMIACLQKDPNKRPKANDILALNMMKGKN